MPVFPVPDICPEGYIVVTDVPYMDFYLVNLDDRTTGSRWEEKGVSFSRAGIPGQEFMHLLLL
jgi:hypothetical protein